MSNDLLTCPFCGSEVEMKEHLGNWGYTPPSAFIKCGPCGLFFSEPTEAWEQGKGHYSIRTEAMLKLAGRWNTRLGQETGRYEDSTH